MTESRVERFRARPSWWRVLGLLAAGAVSAYAFAPYDLFWLTLLGPALLFWWSAGYRPRAAFAAGWLFGFGFFGAGVPWVYNSIHEFGHVVAPAAVFITVGFAAVLALFVGTGLWLAARLTGRISLYLLIAAPLTWVLLEWLKSWVLTGFPWLSLGYAHSDTWLAGFAPLGGVFGISLLVALMAGGLAAVPWLKLRGRVTVLLLFGAFWFGGWGLSRVTWTETTDGPLEVAVLQGNFSQDIKWQREWLAPQMQWYRDRSLENLDADVIVWPEAAIPALAQRISADFLMPLSRRAADAGAAIVLGIPWRDGEGNDYNAIVGLGTSSSLYQKIHLVPLGEYFPFKPLLRLIPGLEHSFFDMTPGPYDQAPFLVDGDPVGMSVCYEDAFGSLNRLALPEAGYLINVTNDAWFGPVAPHQHLQIARMRAMESERWMLRAANTGISAVIDQRGRTVARSALEVSEVLRARVEPRRGATPYVRLGDWPVVALVLAGLIGCAVVGRVRRKPSDGSG